MLLAKTDPTADPPHTRHDRLHRREGARGDAPPGLDDPDAAAAASSATRASSRRSSSSTASARPRRRVLGGEAGVGQGFKYFMSGIEVGRVNVAARGAGARAGGARRRRPLRAASARRSASRSRSHQAVQLMLAKMATRAEAARLLVLQAAQREGARRARRPRGRDGEVLRDRGGAGERARLHARSTAATATRSSTGPSATTATRRCC